MDRTNERRLLWDACYNVRDLGGFATSDGRLTRWRAIVRSDNICRLTRHGRQALVRYGIRTVIDLRSPDELPLETDPFSRGDLDEVAYVNTPLMTEDFLSRYAAGLDDLFELILLDRCRDAVASLFTAVAVAPEGGVLIYCHAGKERTGIAASLLLAFAGVATDVISTEYALSDRYLEPLHAAWIAAQPDRQAQDSMAESLVLRPERMRRVMRHLVDRYGGATEYLTLAGVDDYDLARVRARLLG
jgi:protein-tyrosine phosphatase